jgi:hypothetical protein
LEGVTAVIRNPFSMFWFFIFFFIMTIVGLMYTNIIEAVGDFRQVLLQMASISFVFCAFQLNELANFVNAFRATTDLYLAGSAAAITGVLLMSLTFAHWVFILGAWDWMNRFDDRIFEDAVPMSTPDPMDQPLPMTKVTSSEPPTISKPSPPSPFEEVVVMTEENSPSPESKDENNA